MVNMLPQRGFLPSDNPISKFVDPRRSALMGFSAGMLSGNPGNAMTGAMQGAQLDQQYSEQQAEQAQQSAETNMTKEWLVSKGREDLLPLVDAGKGMFALQEATKVAAGPGGAGAPSNVQEWQYYSGLSPEEQSQYLNMKRSNTPLNIGTGFVTQDQANPGQVLGAPIAIQNEREAYDKGYGAVTGKAAGDTAVLAGSVGAKMPGLRKVIDDLTVLADTATYTMGGQAADTIKRELGLDPGQGAIDRATYIAVVDNQVLPLLKDTFGAAFTVQEGESLRATLGNPNASPQEKKAILDAFISQKERDLAAMQGQSVSATPGGQTSTGLSWRVEQ